MHWHKISSYLPKLNRGLGLVSSAYFQYTKLLALGSKNQIILRIRI